MTTPTSTKSITKARILAALSKAHNWRKKSISSDLKVVSAFARLGFKTKCNDAFGVQTPKYEFDRTRLELDFIEARQDPEYFESLNARWRRNVHRQSEFLDKIYRLQAKAQISGIAPASYKLGDRQFLCWGEHAQLRLIESDLEYFRAEKESVLVNWIDYVVRCGLDPYRYVPGGENSVERWEFCDVEALKTALPFYDWVQLWETKDYTSPLIMRVQGYDHVRKVPKYDDDQLRHSVTINFGSGVDRECAINWISFCACNTTPML